MPRYRLRFLLQEFDLPKGATVIGRSPDCNLTIEDPLVSRQHARISIDDDGASVEDMDSRNGVRVNGTPIHARTSLRDADRVRIGTQDFVLCLVDFAGKSPAKTTGVLSLCAKCRLPYPREMVACPSCEATEQTSEETLSGTFGVESRAAWGVQLLVEALERALTYGRVSDAERIARRATAQVEEFVASGSLIDTKGLAALAVQAAATTVAGNDPTWVLWVIDVYKRTSRVPPSEVVERVGEAAAKHPAIVRDALRGLLEHLHASLEGAQPAEVDAIARLEQVRHGLGPEGGDNVDPGDFAGQWQRPS